MLTAREVAARLGLAVGTINWLVSQGQWMPCQGRRNGVANFFDEAETETFAALHHLGLGASTAAQLAQSGRVEVGSDGAIIIRPISVRTSEIHAHPTSAARPRGRVGRGCGR
jgi:hypothetical protein